MGRSGSPPIVRDVWELASRLLKLVRRLLLLEEMRSSSENSSSSCGLAENSCVCECECECECV